MTRDAIPGLPARLNTARLAAGLGQWHAAERNGLHSVRIAQSENPGRSTSHRVLYRLAAAHGVEVWDFLPPVEEYLRAGGGPVAKRGKRT